MTKSSFLYLIILFYCIQSLEDIEYSEEGPIGILKLNPPITTGLDTKALEEINNILNEINTEKIRALIIDTTLDFEKLNSVDKETQDLMDYYTKLAKESNNKIEISPFPSFLPVKGFLILSNGEIINQIITGNNNIYSNPDIEEMISMDRKEAEKFSEKGNYVLRKIETFPIPTIFIPGKYCLGTSLEIALSCDIRIASNDFLFGLPQVSNGIIPGFGGTQRLARIVGPGIAKQLIFTGERLVAKEALKFGLINAIFPKDELLNEAKKMALNIAKKSLNAVKNAKKAINEGMEENIDDGLKIEEKLFGDCFETEEQKANMENFIKKSIQKNKV